MLCNSLASAIQKHNIQTKFFFLSFFFLFLNLIKVLICPIGHDFQCLLKILADGKSAEVKCRDWHRFVSFNQRSEGKI